MLASDIVDSFLKKHDTSKMATTHEAEALITSHDPHHPANLICELCKKFYTLGWVCRPND
jgi:hypothetical protein